MKQKQSKEHLFSGHPGFHAVCPECQWEGNCFINTETGTAQKNANQEADTHNKNTIHDSGNKTPAYVDSCIGGLD